MKLLFVFLFLFSSCSFFIDSIENTPKIKQQVKAKKNLYCINEKQSLYADNPISKLIFKNILKKNTHLNFIEKSLLWAIFQFYNSPQSFSPSARLQVIVKWNGTFKYYDFATGQNPALSGIQSLIKKYSKKRFLSLLSIIEKDLPKRIPVNSDLANFLNKNKSQKLGKVFYKANETLKKGETFPKVSLISTLTKLTTNTVLNESPTITHKGNNCSPDVEKSSVYSQGLNNQVIGISDDKDNFFIASASLDTSDIKVRHKGRIILGAPGRPSSFCILNGPHKTTAIVSFKERSPGQILLRFLEKLPNDFGPLEIDKALHLPRSMYLQFPDRLLVEEKIFTPIPQYHTTSLGRLLIYHNSSQSSFSGFINDPRSDNELKCLRK